MEQDVDRVVKLRKQGDVWFVIQEHDGLLFARTAYNWTTAKLAHDDLLRLGYRKES